MKNVWLLKLNLIVEMLFTTTDEVTMKYSTKIVSC